MSHTVEKISVWILEATEAEWRREPNLLKCRTADEILGPLKSAHGLTDAEITKAIEFMQSPGRQYLTIVGRGDHKAILPSENGLAILAKIMLGRREEEEKMRWPVEARIAMLALIFTVLTYAAVLLVKWLEK